MRARPQEREVVALDLETTGLSPTGERIIQIAVVGPLEEGKRLPRDLSPSILKWTVFCDPGRPIPAKIIELTGIGNDQVQGQPSFADSVPALLERIEERRVIIQNAIFDVEFLGRELARCGHKLPSCSFVDTMSMARILRVGNSHLRSTAAACDITFRAHDAVEDSFAALAVYHHMRALPGGSDAVIQLETRAEAWQPLLDAHPQWSGLTGLLWRGHGALMPLGGGKPLRLSRCWLEGKRGHPQLTYEMEGAREKYTLPIATLLAGYEAQAGS